MDLNLYIPVAVMLVTLFLLAGNLAYTFSGIDASLNSKRLKQLKKINTQKENNFYEELEEKTKLLAENIISIIPYKKENIENIQKNLNLLNAPIDAMTFIALSFISKIVGIIMILLMMSSIPIVIMSVAIFIIGPEFLLKNAVKNKKEKILQQFPDFLRVVGANLTSGFTFPDSIHRSIERVGSEWQILARELYVNTNLNGTVKALEMLKEKCDMPSVTEFTGIVILAIEQGSSPKEAFAMQERQILAMVRDSYEKQIEKRKVWTFVIQGPLMLALIVLFALPLFWQMKTIM